MYYFLLLHSSFAFIIDSPHKFAIILLCGSILYMISHALLYNTTLAPVLQPYYWNILFLDIAISGYCIYNDHSAASIQDIKFDIGTIKNKLYTASTPISQLRPHTNPYTNPPTIPTSGSTSPPSTPADQQDVINVAAILDENKSVASDIASIMDLTDF
jgi:hypothetical protein